MRTHDGRTLTAYDEHMNNNVHYLGRHRKMTIALPIHNDGDGVGMLDVMAYAEAHGVNHRTVREWLANDLLPGAMKDTRGKWFIPANAVRQEKQAVATREDEPVQEGPRRMPAFFSVADAAAFLGLSEYRVRQEREAFEVKPWGDNGALVVPAYVIRRYLGL
jgi:hypothetical protein